MSTIQDKIRAIMAKTVANGCTGEEAASAYDMAVRLIEKHGLAGEYDFAQFIGKPFSAKGKGKRAKAAKQPKDDGRLRVIKAASSPDAKGKRKWTVMMTVRHSELKAKMADMRAKGMVVKSGVVK
jgi:hypothetical protein